MDTDDLRLRLQAQTLRKPSYEVDRSIPYSTSEYDEQTGTAFLLDG
jgi:hypothetical protein